MTEDLSLATRATITPSARRAYLVGSLVSIPFVALGVVAMIGRGRSAQASGDSATATAIFVSGGIAGGVVAALVASFVIYLAAKGRSRRRKFAVLLAAWPDGMFFMVSRPLISLTKGQLPELAGLRPSDIDAIVFFESDVLITKVRVSATTLVRVIDPQGSVELGLRRIGNGELSQLIMTLTTGWSVTLAVLPIDVREFAHPPFENLGALTTAVKSRLAQAPS